MKTRKVENNSVTVHMSVKSYSFWWTATLNLPEKIHTWQVVLKYEEAHRNMYKNSGHSTFWHDRMTGGCEEVCIGNKVI